MAEDTNDLNLNQTPTRKRRRSVAREGGDEVALVAPDGTEATATREDYEAELIYQGYRLADEVESTE